MFTQIIVEKQASHFWTLLVILRERQMEESCTWVIIGADKGIKKVLNWTLCLSGV